MLINKNKSEVILIPPKTGTMSINNMVMSLLPKPDRFYNITNRHSHIPLNSLNEGDINELDKIYITSRNPIPRLKSMHKFLYKGILNNLKKQNLDKNILDRFKYLTHTQFLKILKNICTDNNKTIDESINQGNFKELLFNYLDLPIDLAPKFTEVIFRSQISYLGEYKDKDNITILKLENLSDMKLEDVYHIFITEGEPKKLFKGKRYSEMYNINDTDGISKDIIITEESNILSYDLYKEDFDFFGY